MTRPEEERSRVESSPEIAPVPLEPTSPMEIATALVSRWENDLGLKQGPQYVYTRLVLTNDVRDRMRDDIAAALNAAISREHVGD